MAVEEPGSRVVPVFALDLPHGRCLGVAIPPTLTPALLAELHPAERQFLDSLTESRRPFFAAGRVALRAALVDLAAAHPERPELGRAPQAPLLPDRRGAPQLPPGALGSISHKRTLAIALVAPAPTGPEPAADIGVDLEEVRTMRVDISRRVLTEPERARLALVPPAERDHRLIQHFSLKEAFYKAVNGFGFAYVSFHDVEVSSLADDGTVELSSALLFPNRLSVRAWVGSPWPGFIVAAARVWASGRP